MKLIAISKWIGFAVVVVALLLLVSVALSATNTVAGMQVGPERCTEAPTEDPDAHEDCRRLMTFARQLLDQASHEPLASVKIYGEPASNILHTVSGFGDFAVVAFELSDETSQAFYVRCGISFSKDLCVDLRPLKPGEWTVEDVPAHPNPVLVP